MFRCFGSSCARDRCYGIHSIGIIHCTICFLFKSRPLLIFISFCSVRFLGVVSIHTFISIRSCDLVCRSELTNTTATTITSKKSLRIYFFHNSYSSSPFCLFHTNSYVSTSNSPLNKWTSRVCPRHIRIHITYEFGDDNLCGFLVLYQYVFFSFPSPTTSFDLSATYGAQTN